MAVRANLFNPPTAVTVVAQLENTPIKLYSFPTSPYGMKVGCYLAYKKLDYEFVGVSPITFRQVAFTNHRQVPVLEIGDEWKLESSEIGIWLEEVFPGHQLLGNNEYERKKILAIDKWVDDQLITAMFRIGVDWPTTMIGLKNGWKLARAVNQSSPLPRWVRWLWPVFIKRARFIQAMMGGLDRSISLKNAQALLVQQFEGHLSGGPFLGGMQQPSLADLSAYPIIVWPYRFGLQGDADWFANESIKEWINSMQKFLPENPYLVSQNLLIFDNPG